MSSSNLTIFLVPICLYSLLLIMVIIQMVRLFKNKAEQNLYLVQFRTHSLLIVFLLARLLTLTLEFQNSTSLVWLFVIKRIAYLVFFTSFTLLLYFWVKISHSFQRNRRNRQTAKIPFIIINVVLYGFSLICVMIFGLSLETVSYNNSFYKANVLIIAAAFFLQSIGFVAYGIILFRKFKKMSGLFPDRKTFLAKITFVSLLISLCFLVRFVVLLYYPITARFLNSWLFLISAYLIPEIIPTLVQLIVLRPRIITEMGESETHLISDEKEQSTLYVTENTD
ncbi:tobamovirus multiplication protein 1-like isoform x1 [Anaeramoeba ignava]|uniref:Tobamovirus multiplication protein 1-like isoform x1 n=1 Tax=Anaeramoeba ignava TaxID=1746090 RepID=A0A9Q0LHW9_ANAIG|nr:tobamovirus multiplication protein 1-like isoform x1 [Anaeramoeba ignava]